MLTPGAERETALEGDQVAYEVLQSPVPFGDIEAVHKEWGGNSSARHLELIVDVNLEKTGTNKVYIYAEMCRNTKYWDKIRESFTFQNRKVLVEKTVCPQQPNTTQRGVTGEEGVRLGGEADHCRTSQVVFCCSALQRL